MPLITNIQKYSIHDGDGIRTTVFFKGCPLKCTWCHNPETQSRRPVLLENPERCTGCGACVRACPFGAVSLQYPRNPNEKQKAGGDTDAGSSPERYVQKAVTDRNRCTACGTCTDYCLSNLREIAGKEYTVEELVKEVRKDEMFYEESGGGVTLSGGEVMTADIDFVEKLAKRLYQLGISVMIDTCGQAPYENFRKILPYVDTFLYDMKAMDPQVHKQHMGAGNELILDNLQNLSNDQARIYIRIPVIKGVNGNQREMQAIADFLQDRKIRAERIYLLPYHNTGSAKYVRLGMEYAGAGLCPSAREEMEQFAEIFHKTGFSCVKIEG